MEWTWHLNVPHARPSRKRILLRDPATGAGSGSPRLLDMQRWKRNTTSSSRAGSGGGSVRWPAMSACAADDEWLDSIGAACYLGISMNSIRRLTRAGHLPARRPRLRFRRAELDAFVTQARIQPGS
ncbi:MAG: helix-turn-helix domain-containing protein, partial [Actinobacteria bacterium]|nr:helix-turn-helix domain-containing protein [Actinomycetota bacterium]